MIEQIGFLKKSNEVIYGKEREMLEGEYWDTASCCARQFAANKVNIFETSVLVPDLSMVNEAVAWLLYTSVCIVRGSATKRTDLYVIFWAP